MAAERPPTHRCCPSRSSRWFAGRGWTPRAHQLELLAKARAGRSVLLIAPTGAGKTLAGFLPSLVELSAPARSEASPDTSSSPPGATSAARAGCTRSTSRRSRRSPSTSRAIWNGRWPRWGCRSASRPAPATRRPRSASASAAIRRTSCSRRRSSLRCVLASPDAPYLFGSLKRVVLDELHALVTSKRGDLLSLGLARLFTLAPDLASVGLSATVGGARRPAALSGAAARATVPRSPIWSWPKVDHRRR